MFVRQGQEAPNSAGDRVSSNARCTRVATSAAAWVARRWLALVKVAGW
ncbi:MAG: hypothetical protein M3Y48_16315 [Actinomycetota bacterium]|nr:hypothetical protein [Actinomycetota bacterium]